MISVVISIYKVEKYLEQCINSVLNQTYSNFELILIDDGSPDRCPQICDEYATKDKRIRVIHQVNSGLMNTRKRGISEAVGDYVCFIDGDDFIQQDLLEMYTNEIDKNKADMICASFKKYFENTQATCIVKQKIPCGFYDKKSLREKVYPRMLSTMPFFSFFVFPSLCIKCFKKEIVSDIYENVPSNITLGEDAAITYPALLAANSVSVINYYGYNYRYNLSSMTHSYDKALFEKLKTLLRYLMAIKTDEDWDSERQLSEYAVFLLLLACNNELSYNKNDRRRMKIKNFKKYLADEIFLNSINRVNLTGFKNRLFLGCMKHEFIFPLYLWSQKNV